MKAVADLWMKVVTILGGLLIFVTVWAMDAMDKSGIVYQLNGYVMNLAYGMGLILLGFAYYEIRRK